MSNDELARLLNISRKFRKQTAIAVREVAFLEDISDEEKRRFEIYKESSGGLVIALISAVLQDSVIAFCARHWDKSSDSLSILNALELIQNLKSVLIEMHSAECEALGSSFDALAFLSRLQILSERSQDLADCDAYKVTRVLRTETIAHSLLDSKDRDRLFGSSEAFDQHGVTRADLFDFARETIKAMEEVIYLVERVVPASRDQAKSFEGHIDNFWSNQKTYLEAERSRQKK